MTPELAKIIEMGAKALVETLKKVYEADTGTSFRKTEKRREIEREVVQTYLKILDHAFKLGTAGKCRYILGDKAVEMGLLVKIDVPPMYALKTPEDKLYGDLSKIPVR